MHIFLRSCGTLLVVTALLIATAFVLLTGGASSPAPGQIQAAPATDLPTAAANPQASLTPAPSATAPTSDTPSGASPAAATPTAEAPLPITRLVIASIDLDTDVVAAPLVDSHGVRTWQVPAFKAGHAEDTAGAGERGNAVLMGHVSSVHSGDVFKNLDHVQLGDQVDVFSGERHFTYVVSEVRSVARSDLTLVEPTSAPTISLFTCTGVWDPIAWDFTERLFVRATLVGAS